MRPLEIAVVVIAGLYPVAGVLAPRLKAVHALPLLAAGLTTVHLMVEGYRWQMVPIYSAVAVMAWVGWRLLRKPVPGLHIGRNEPSKIGLFALIPMGSLDRRPRPDRTGRRRTTRVPVLRARSPGAGPNALVSGCPVVRR